MISGPILANIAPRAFIKFVEIELGVAEDWKQDPDPDQDLGTMMEALNAGRVMERSNKRSVISWPSK